MKTVKYFILVLAVLSVVSCKPDCSINKPRNLKSIDWEKYNDVFTVYWNAKMLCEDMNNSLIFNREVKVYGFVQFKTILDKDPYIREDMNNTKNAFHLIIKNKGVSDILTNADLTKKCYIKGKLVAAMIETQCCRILPEIWLESVDDIYFEE